METIEALVYITVAIIAGILIINILKSADLKELYAGMIKKKVPEPPKTIKVLKSDFAERLMDKWKDCGYGELNKEYALYVEDSGTISREEILNGRIKINMCNTIGCSNQTTLLAMPEIITIPKVINIKCFNNSLIVN